jgi:hypothetical protein
MREMNRTWQERFVGRNDGDPHLFFTCKLAPRGTIHYVERDGFRCGVARVNYLDIYYDPQHCSEDNLLWPGFRAQVHDTASTLRWKLSFQIEFDDQLTPGVYNLRPDIGCYENVLFHIREPIYKY